MKMHISSKLTEYLINIFKMRLPMRNCLKYVKQCQNDFFKKTCQEYSVFPAGALKALVLRTRASRAPAWKTS